MKIMSLNVNRFRVLRLSEGSWAKEIISFVKRFLGTNPNNVVFLYEIPESFYSSQGTGELDEALKPYTVTYAGKSGKSFTIAVQTPEKKWEKQTNLIWGTDYQNKCVELRYEKLNLSVLGIHAPLPSRNYSYEDVRNYLAKLQEYAQKLKDQNFIILGDFNITTNKWRTDEINDELEWARRKQKNEKIIECEDFLERRKWLLETMTSEPIGYSDAIIGDPITFFWVEKNKNGREKGTTIDHVLVSPALQGKVTAQVIPREVLELSDHAVIIVDVDL